jgi:hypothetical protein
MIGSRITAPAALTSLYPILQHSKESIRIDMVKRSVSKVTLNYPLDNQPGPVFIASKTFLYRWNIFFRNVTTFYSINEQL